jgi:hypothetical protein
MRFLSLIGAICLLAFPASAFASAGAVGDGSLSVANANVNSIVVSGHGLIYGYVDQGAVTVISYTPDDSNQFQISGTTVLTKTPSGYTRYAGSAMRFLISGTYSLRFEGSGINVSAVGKGTVAAVGSDPLAASSTGPNVSSQVGKSVTTTIGSDNASSSDGTLAANGGKPQSLGHYLTVTSFGVLVPTKPST